MFPVWIFLLSLLTALSAQAVVLRPSPPQVAENDYQTIANCYIRAEKNHGILVRNKKGVVIRNCLIEYRQGHHGIIFYNSPNLTIEDCEIRLLDAPPKGALKTIEANCIEGNSSDNLKIRRVTLRQGSAGIYLRSCHDAQMHSVEGHDFRGPFPRGQLLQFDRCVGGLLTDFSCETPVETAFPEDNINCYKSHGQTIRRGLIVGNNAPNGVGVLFEDQNKPDSSGGEKGVGGLVEDVDLLQMGNGACSGADGSRGITFRRVRVKSNHATAKGGRPDPLSGALVFSGYGVGQDIGKNLVVEDCTVFDLAKPKALTWPDGSFSKTEIKTEDFTPRPPIRHNFSWLVAAQHPTAGRFWLRNVWTKKFLNGDMDDWAGVTATTFRPDWLSQQWDLEQGKDGQWKVRNAWSQRYLTGDETIWNRVRTADQQPAWKAQKWALFELTPYVFRLDCSLGGLSINTPEEEWAPLQIGPPRTDWHSMQWELVPVK